jgi:hypothetical protein
LRLAIPPGSLIIPGKAPRPVARRVRRVFETHRRRILRVWVAGLSRTRLWCGLGLRAPQAFRVGRHVSARGWCVCAALDAPYALRSPTSSCCKITHAHLATVNDRPWYPGQCKKLAAGEFDRRKMAAFQPLGRRSYRPDDWLIWPLADDRTAGPSMETGRSGGISPARREIRRGGR